ncbi:nitrile hydratase subunit beta [Tritonibacter scottomollicae]|uniref:nitrile hydratase subunit beta n=1 Tax=Tritonibacter scottomollicae TaxID=483013 RepID=UPI003AA95657
MSRLHDMGGRYGDGQIEPEAEDAPVFSEEWHARALAVTLACGSLGQWNIDMSRHARERLSPVDYARFSYYEKWMAALANLLVEQGVLSREDLRDAPGIVSEGASEGEHPAKAHPLSPRRLTAQKVAGVLAAGGPADRASAVEVRFQPGDRVRTRRSANTLVDGGHTRLPTYVSAAQGVILRQHGSHVLPDCNAHSLGEAPEPLYAVMFEAGALWTHAEHPGDEVVLDLWQSYLEPV